MTDQAPEPLLEKRVHDLKNEVAALAGGIETLTRQLTQFATSEELEERLEKLEKGITAQAKERLDSLEKNVNQVHETRLRKQRHQILALILAVVVLGGFGFWTFHSQARARAIDGCHRRNDTNLVIRKVIDRSATNGGNIDLSKLTPAEQQFLRDFAAAQPSDKDPQSFHAFVYSLTEPQDCSKY